ncbi:MAG TPA: acyl-CoA dehydrogenase family protein [Conexivisphaerales archaeon]|nr:acyl-CoA dehydrogenase family protein [Conexivisphaerales archaeon]
MVFPLAELGDYAITFRPEHEMFRKVVREFFEKEVEPRVSEIEENDRVPDDLLKKMGEMGLQGIAVPQEYGGQGGDQVSVAIFCEEAGRVYPAIMTLVGVNGLFTVPIMLFGTEEQKGRYLPPVAKGEKHSAHATTEAGAGSDVAGIQTRAERRGDRWVLNGRKAFISGGDIADYFVVLTRTSPPPSRKERWKGLTFFILEKGMRGFSVARKMNKSGLKGSPIVELQLDNVEVPDSNRLGNEGDGFKIAMETFDHARIGVAAQALGIAQSAFEKSLNYAMQRSTFDRLLIQQQAIDNYLADMLMKLVSARHMVYWASCLADAGRKEYLIAASMAKAYATEAAEFAAIKAISIHGGVGVVMDSHIERMLRDVEITKVYEGSNEIQRLVIIRQLLRQTLGFDPMGI